MTARFIIEGDIPDEATPYPASPAVVTIRRRDGVNGTVTMTHVRRPDSQTTSRDGTKTWTHQNWTWELSGEAVDPAHQPMRGWLTYDGGNLLNVSALRAAKSALLGVSPGEKFVTRRSTYEVHREQEAKQDAVRLAKVRESKAKYMRKWRAANPELAAQKNREQVAAYRARRKAARS